MRGMRYFPSGKLLNRISVKKTEEGLEILIPKGIKQLEQLMLFMVHFE